MEYITNSEPVAMERPKAEAPINELIELKPCPFCGGKAAIGYGQSEYDDVISISVLCQTCRIGIFQYRTDPNEVYDGFKTEQEAADAWNRRTGHE